VQGGEHVSKPLKIKISKDFIDSIGFDSGSITRIQLNFIYTQAINSITSTIKATCKYLNVPQKKVIEGDVDEKTEFTWG
tara:strand:+ start:814 stop:1050 length:237 start_codon:yes stop_codon:yes gene_type:complete